MSSIEYALFRAKFIKPSNPMLFGQDISPHDLFLKSIEEKPSAELRVGYTWHIGNINYFDANHGYFAVGRTTNATIGKFDEASGNFIEEKLETSPYTHCVFDANIGFLGIARKSTLAPTSKGIASTIEKLLAKTDVVFHNDITVEIAPIPDPEGFIRALSTAYRVTSFAATFKGPNPFDADEFFQKPLSVYLSAARGNKGKAQIQGADLDREVLQEVSRSTAATGNEASARINRTKRQKAITINLRGDPVKRRYDEAEHDPRAVLADLTQLYNRVRTNE